MRQASFEAMQSTSAEKTSNTSGRCTSHGAPHLQTGLHCVFDIYISLIGLTIIISGIAAHHDGLSQSQLNVPMPLGASKSPHAN